MTSSKTQIQALINKIDEVLSASNTTRSSAGQSEDVPQQQVLEQARNYLASLQKGSTRLEATPAETSPLGSVERPQPAIAQQEWWRDRPSTASNLSPAATEMGYVAPPAESAQQVLQAIVQEMNYLRVNMMQPLREELMSLYQQRQLLTSDIQQLEQQRHQLLLSQQQINQQQIINDFMQSLMGRLQEQLATQIAQSIEGLQLQASQVGGLPQSTEMPQLNPGHLSGPQLTPGQRLQQMQMLQARSDEMLMKLDSTLHAVFESLQGNLESYQDSLGQGLKKMHGMGQQGEAMFAALINRLAEQLGRGASQYIQNSMRTEWELPGLQSVDSSDAGGVPQQQPQYQSISTIPDKLPDDQVNRMLDDLGLDESRESSAADSIAPLIDELLSEAQEESSAPALDFNLDDLQLPVDDTLMQAIAEADAAAPAETESSPSDRTGGDDMMTLFSIEDEGVVDQVDASRISQLEDLDADLFLSELNELAGSDDASTDNDDTAADNISDAISDEALDFLDQVATEMEADLASTFEIEEASSDASAIAEDPRANANLADERTTPEQGDRSSEPADEIEDVYQMFDAVVTPGSSETSSPSWDADDSNNEQTIEDPSDTAAEQGSGAMDATEPMLLEDMLFDDADSSEAESAFETTQGSQSESDLLELWQGDDSGRYDPGAETLELTSELSAPEDERPESTDEDLFSQLGITTQNNPADAYDTAPDQVETINTLDELATLDQPIRDAQGDRSVSASRSSATSDFELEGSSDFDRYIMASPDEDLLAPEQPLETLGSNLQLDSTTIQRLASDLSGFEGIDESEVMLPSSLTPSSAPDSSTANPPTTEEPSQFPDANDISDAQTAETVEGLFADEQLGDEIPESVKQEQCDPSESFPAASSSDDISGFLSSDDVFFALEQDHDEGAESLSEDSEPSDSDEVGLSDWADLEPSGDMPADDNAMTVDQLFSLTPESPVTGDRSIDQPEEQFDPLDSDDLRQIFEDLKALDDYEADSDSSSQEQTLVDLLKGINPPTLPHEQDNEPTQDTDIPSESDISWSIFDDLKEPDSSPESEQKKNSDDL